MKAEGNASASEVFRKLLDGNVRFRESNNEYPKLSEAQNPDYVIISCSDSRVSPSIITNSPLGSLFEIRIAGGVLDKSAIASIEFALEKLDLKGILMVGHTKCGAVIEAQKLFFNEGNFELSEKGTSLNEVVKNIFEDISRNHKNRNDLTNAIKENTAAQMKVLLKNEVVKEKLDSGSLAVSAALYDIESGNLELI